MSEFQTCYFMLKYALLHVRAVKWEVKQEGSWPNRYSNIFFPLRFLFFENIAPTI